MLRRKISRRQDLRVSSRKAKHWNLRPFHAIKRAHDGEGSTHLSKGRGGRGRDGGMVERPVGVKRMAQHRNRDRAERATHMMDDGHREVMMACEGRVERYAARGDRNEPAREVG